MEQGVFIEFGIVGPAADEAEGFFGEHDFIEGWDDMVVGGGDEGGVNGFVDGCRDGIGGDGEGFFNGATDGHFDEGEGGNEKFPSAGVVEFAEEVAGFGVHGKWPCGFRMHPIVSSVKIIAHGFRQFGDDIAKEFASALIGEDDFVAVPALVGFAVAVEGVEVFGDDLGAFLAELVGAQIGFAFAFAAGVNEPSHPCFVGEDFEDLTGDDFFALGVEGVVDLIEDGVGDGVAAIGVFVLFDGVLVELKELGEDIDFVLQPDLVAVPHGEVTILASFGLDDGASAENGAVEKLFLRVFEGGAELICHGKLPHNLYMFFCFASQKFDQNHGVGVILA